MNQAHKNLRYFIYIHAHAKSRSEGYRLVKKLMEETKENCSKEYLTRTPCPMTCPCSGKHISDRLIAVTKRSRNEN